MARAPRTQHLGGSRSARAAEPAEGAGPPADPEAVARILCLRQLEARSRTRTELVRYLDRKGVPEDAARRVLDRFTEVGLIDDDALARSFSSSRHAEQGLARRAIAAKLRQRGVDHDVISSAVATVGPEQEQAAARRLVAKRRRSLVDLDPAVQSRRLVSLLARKGYPSGLAYQVVREALNDPGEAGSDGEAPR